MSHKKSKFVMLDRKDLELILVLIDVAPESEDIGVLKGKIEESLSICRWEDSLVDLARKKLDSEDIL